MKNNLVSKKNIFTLCLLALSASSFSKDCLISLIKRQAFALDKVTKCLPSNKPLLFYLHL